MKLGTQVIHSINAKKIIKELTSKPQMSIEEESQMKEILKNAENDKDFIKMK